HLRAVLRPPFCCGLRHRLQFLSSAEVVWSVLERKAERLCFFCVEGSRTSPNVRRLMGPGQLMSDIYVLLESSSHEAYPCPASTILIYLEISSISVISSSNLPSIDILLPDPSTSPTLSPPQWLLPKTPN